MHRFVLLFLTMGLTTGLAGAARAEFNYDWIGVTYNNVDFDDLDVDGDGFGFDVTLGIAENYHLFGGAETADLDFNVDLTSWRAGIGFNTPLSEAVDVIAQLSYENLEIDTSIGDADDNGFGLGVGVRVEATNLVELNGAIRYVDFSDSGDDAAFDAAVLFNLTESFTIGLNGTFDDDVNTYRLAGRYYF